MLFVLYNANIVTTKIFKTNVGLTLNQQLSQRGVSGPTAVQWHVPNDDPTLFITHHGGFPHCVPRIIQHFAIHYSIELSRQCWKDIAFNESMHALGQCLLNDFFLFCFWTLATPVDSMPWSFFNVAVRWKRVHVAITHFLKRELVSKKKE